MRVFHKHAACAKYCAQAQMVDGYAGDGGGSKETVRCVVSAGHVADLCVSYATADLRNCH